jgi:3-hydroxyacyl-CoA dehydrogenase/enoyl-CoA hydratase/3-hydroxybutyryl-CoA epimerase
MEKEGPHMEYRKITFDVIDQIARIGFGKTSTKPLTTLDLETMEELDTALTEITERQEKEIAGLIFFSHKKNVFLAGMDVAVIRDLKDVQSGVEGARDGQRIYNQIEDLLIPTITCVDGVCLGGGFELALACRTILVSDSPHTVLGAPEVSLGLLPGFGGSYRLPRRIDLAGALDLMLSGRLVRAEAAKKMGLVDEVCAGEELVERAISRHIRDRKEGVSLAGPIKQAKMPDPVARESIFKKARESVLTKTKGHYEAPLRILDLLESSFGDPRSSYLEKEAQLLGELAVSEQSRNLQHVYFLHANSQKYAGPVGDKARRIIRTGAVVGAGTMGGGIAWLMAGKDMSPIMKDVDARGLETGLKQSETMFSEGLKRKQESIKAQLDYRGFKSIDWVAEAVVEKMETKKSVLAEIEKEVRDDCLITSTTSSLSLREMASVLAKPERFAGLHFRNPVNRVPLVEIVTHDQIAPETVSALYEWAVSVKKVPVVVKDGPGFLVNRILTPFINEGLHLLDEGVPMDALERAFLNFGMPRGPCRLLDEVGFDVWHRVVTVLNDSVVDRFRPTALYDKMSDLTYYGKKSKKGFFHYDDQGRETDINEGLLECLPARKVKMSEKDIQERVLLPMINEAAMVLQDRVVRTVEEIDLGLVFGIGFPRFRGGLLRYADSKGLDNILKALDQYARDPDARRFEACALIREMVKKKKAFYV